jgi:hypothetical protein
VFDELLKDLDRAFADSERRTASPRGPLRIAVAPAADPAPAPRTRTAFRDAYPLVEMFLAAQFLWGALLFVPGIQGYRAVIRALPYLSSVALIVPYLPKRMGAVTHPGSASFLVAALGLLVLNLLHSTTQSTAGLAQCIFQFSVAAPVFWAWKAVQDEHRLLRAVRLVFLFSALSASLGILQVYFPERFMPPQFAALGLQLNESWVDSLTYEGADGRLIVRPPGLTDQPGGASIAGATSAILGLGLTLVQGAPGGRLVALAGTAVGLAVLYLTQVRSLLLLCVGAFVVMALVMFRRGRVGASAWLVGGGGALVVASFIWATSVGGEQVQARYTDITQKGAVATFRENRGHFLSYTVGELLDQFPLGAGVGRWGMMYVYFGDPANLNSPPIHAEIQLTGWLLDGGVPMWMLYGGAILAALSTAVRLAQQRASPLVADLATVCLALMVLVVGMSFAGPVFNTQTGILFWFLAAGLYGAGAGYLRRKARYYGYAR